MDVLWLHTGGRAAVGIVKKYDPYDHKISWTGGRGTLLLTSFLIFRKLRRTLNELQ